MGAHAIAGVISLTMQTAKGRGETWTWDRLVSREMIYTCYEMIRDCRADKPEGWNYFITQYVPVIRRMLAHYAPGRVSDGAVVERILMAARKPESSLFQSLEPAPERWFVAELRQKVLAELDAPAAELGMELETVAAALEPLTLTEKQVAWLETMQYGAGEIGAMLRMAPATAEKIRGKAAELLRGSGCNWRQAILAENGMALSRAAAAASTKDCLAAKVFLDILDGRTTWRGREEMERHVNGCWHCIDRFCRMVETIELIRGVEPLTDTEAAPLRALLGVRVERPSVWKRLAGRG